MSQANCQQFIEQLQQDQEIQSQLRGAQSNEDFPRRFVEVGTNHGYELSIEDANTVLDTMMQSAANQRNLAEEELATVAAGIVTIEYLVLMTSVGGGRANELATPSAGRS